MIRIISNEDKYREVYINYSGKNYYVPYGAKIYLKNYVLSDIDMRFFTSGYKLDIACDTKEIPNGLENIYPDFLDKYVNPTLNFLPEIKAQFGNSDIRFGIVDPRGNVLYPTLKPSGANYNELDNKPQINGIQLFGNKTTDQLGLASDEDIARIDRRIDSNLDRIRANTASIELLQTTKVNKMDGYTLVSPEDRLKLDGLPPSTEGGVVSVQSLDNLKTELYENLASKVTYEHNTESGDTVKFPGVLSEQNFTNAYMQKLKDLPDAARLNELLKSKLDISPNERQGGCGLKEYWIVKKDNLDDGTVTISEVPGNGLSDYNLNQDDRNLLDTAKDTFLGTGSVLFSFLQSYFPKDIFGGVPETTTLSEWTNFFNSLKVNKVRSLTSGEIGAEIGIKNLADIFNRIIIPPDEVDTDGTLTADEFVKLILALSSGLQTINGGEYNRPATITEVDDLRELIGKKQDTEDRKNKLEDLNDDPESLATRYPSLQLISKLKNNIDSELDKIDGMQVKDNLVQLTNESGEIIESESNTKYPSVDFMNSKLKTKLDTKLSSKGKVLITHPDTGDIVTTDALTVGNTTDSGRLEDLLRNGLTANNIKNDHMDSGDPESNEDKAYSIEYINRNMVTNNRIVTVSGDDTTIPSVGTLNKKFPSNEGQWIYEVSQVGSSGSNGDWKKIRDTDVQWKNNKVDITQPRPAEEYRDNQYPTAKSVIAKFEELSGEITKVDGKGSAYQLISNKVDISQPIPIDGYTEIQYPTANSVIAELNKKFNTEDLDLSFVNDISFNSDNNADEEHWEIIVKKHIYSNGTQIANNPSTINLPNVTKAKAGLMSVANYEMLDKINTDLYREGVEGFLKKTGDNIEYATIEIADVNGLFDDLSAKLVSIEANTNSIDTINGNKVTRITEDNNSSNDKYPSVNAVTGYVSEQLSHIGIDIYGRISGIDTRVETLENNYTTLNGDVVKYTDTSDGNNPNRKSIILENHNNILGKITSGETRNLIMLSKWDKCDVGSNSIEMNLNGSADNPTYNDKNKILLDSNIVGRIQNTNSLEITSKEYVDTIKTELSNTITTNKNTYDTGLSTKVNLSQVQMLNGTANDTTPVASVELMNDKLDEKVNKGTWIDANNEVQDSVLSGVPFTDIDDAKLTWLPGTTDQFKLGNQYKNGNKVEDRSIVKPDTHHEIEERYHEQRLIDVLEGTFAEDYYNPPKYLFPGKVDKQDGHSLIRDYLLNRVNIDGKTIDGATLYDFTNVPLDNLFAWPIKSTNQSVTVKRDFNTHTTDIDINTDNVIIESDNVKVDYQRNISGYTPDVSETSDVRLPAHLLGISNQFDTLRSQSSNKVITDSSILDNGVWLYSVDNQTTEHNKGVMRWTKFVLSEDTNKFFKFEWRTVPHPNGDIDNTCIRELTIGLSAPDDGSDGEFVLKAIRKNGVVTYKWEHVV